MRVEEQPIGQTGVDPPERRPPREERRQQLVHDLESGEEPLPGQENLHARRPQHGLQPERPAIHMDLGHQPVEAGTIFESRRRRSGGAGPVRVGRGSRHRAAHHREIGPSGPVEVLRRRRSQHGPVGGEGERRVPVEEGDGPRLDRHQPIPAKGTAFRDHVGEHPAGEQIEPDRRRLAGPRRPEPALDLAPSAPRPEGRRSAGFDEFAQLGRRGGGGAERLVSARAHESPPEAGRAGW